METKGLINRYRRMIKKMFKEEPELMHMLDTQAYNELILNWKIPIKERRCYD